jgi:alpha-galactosidase/6-phospho-beta-glucosidase family protein
MVQARLAEHTAEQRLILTAFVPLCSTAPKNRLLRRMVAVEAAVQAALTGDRKLMAEALVLDGGVDDYGVAERLTEHLLRAQAAYLPQFN